MSIELSDLIERLQSDIPAEDGVPSDEQYENAIKDAVRDFSERCGVEQIGTIDIVSGTSTYDLPADFLKLIRLTSLTGEGVLHSASGQLIPVPSTWCEKHTIRGGQIRFYPIPRYTLTRDIYYKAAWVLTDDDYGGVYETMTEREARIVLLKAKANAKTKQANAQAGDSIKYSFGAVSEDLGDVSDSSRKDAKTFEGEYLEACEKYNGQVGVFG